MDNTPLAEALRPQSLGDFVGQKHLVGENGIISKFLETKKVPSMILWGPPGSGKTALARLIANQLDLPMTELSGVEFSSKELQKLKLDPQVVFVDEIHRLNKSQQASFLPYTERGQWILIGATTENPSFEVISPLLSRCRVFLLNELEAADLEELINRAEKYLNKSSKFEVVGSRAKNLKPKTYNWKLNSDSRAYLAELSSGDARFLLNTIQNLHQLHPEKAPDLGQIKEILPRMHLRYDKGGEEHYNAISALHKSMRGSDATASLYYLARMLQAGEDPLYIARRCIRFAAEDIGNMDRGALFLANSAFDAAQKIGMPECEVVLAQLVMYLAQAKKSNQAYTAYAQAKADVAKYGPLPIPLKLRNAPTKLMKEVGYGKDYKYAPDFKPEDLKDEQYLPDEIKGHNYL